MRRVKTAGQDYPGEWATAPCQCGMRMIAREENMVCLPSHPPKWIAAWYWWCGGCKSKADGGQFDVLPPSSEELAMARWIEKQVR